nr:MAG TPA: hypothetical protein [Caudoviricetes sp.]
MRLIEESELKKSIEKWLNPDQNADRMVDINDIVVSVMMEIEEQPTAYDVDKVVAELERKKFIEQETILSDVHQGFNAGLSMAIQIVKGGGVDGD